MLTLEDSGLLNGNAFGFLATVNADPHVSAVWTEFEEPHVVITSERRFAKATNVQRDPRVSLAVVDPTNPYRQLVIFGAVVAIESDGAADRTDWLAQRYLNLPQFPRPSIVSSNPCCSGLLRRSSSEIRHDPLWRRFDRSTYELRARGTS